MNETARPVPTYLDAEGNICADSRFSPTGNTVRAAVCAPAPNVVPIVFVPGIMGSSLRAKREIREAGGSVSLAQQRQPVWRVDSAAAFGLKWSRYTAAQRQLLLDHTALEVDPDGRVEISQEEKQAVARRIQARQSLPTEQHYIDAWTPIIADKRRRGWGTVSRAFYGGFLQWLEDNLKDLSLLDGQPSPTLSALFALAGTVPDGASRGSATVPTAPLTPDMIERLTEFQLPVWAVGYNWAASNLDSGEYLAGEIERIVGEYDGKRGQSCSKVIVVTHSMGGLVARAATKRSGAEDRIAGIVHGVMPTHGAAAMYKRAIAGFGNEGDWFMETIVGGLLGVSGARALGRTARETLPVLAFNPGPLELAPNHRYNDGKPWLFIKDRRGKTLKTLPEHGDPYAEIYRRMDVWWRMVNPEWLNPARLRGPIEDFIGKFKLAIDTAENYHRALADNGFHPETYAHYSIDRRHPAWGEMTFDVVASHVYVPSAHGVGLGAPIAALPQRLDLPRKMLHGTPETWRIERHDAVDELFLRDAQGGEMRARILPKADAGDATVPAQASAAAVDRHSKVLCRHPRGYAHDASYSEDRVRLSVVDAVVRIMLNVPVVR